MFDTTKVERRVRQSGFKAQEFNLELTKCTVRTAQTGTPVITITYQVRGERYNNLRVIDQLFVTEDAFPIAVNKLVDAGFTVPEIRGSKAENVAAKLHSFIQSQMGHTCRGFVVEDGEFHKVRFYV